MLPSVIKKKKIQLHNSILIGNKFETQCRNNNKKKDINNKRAKLKNFIFNL